jgi:hypothetical protein
MTKKRKSPRPQSAADLLQNMHDDPVFAERERERERDRALFRERYARAAKPLLEDLAAAGYHVSSLAELRRGREYPDAIPVLMKWVRRSELRDLKEDIIRALSVPWGAEAADLLFSEFAHEQDEGIRWAIANALEVIVTSSSSHRRRLIKLAGDPKYGKSREMLVLALANVSDAACDDVISFLIELLSDAEVAGHALVALGRLRALPARGRVEHLLEHPNKWIRDEARKALREIDSTE